MERHIVAQIMNDPARRFCDLLGAVVQTWNHKLTDLDVPAGLMDLSRAIQNGTKFALGDLAIKVLIHRLQ